MQRLTFPEVLEQVLTLSPEDQGKLREILDAPTETQKQMKASRESARLVSLRDFSADRQWLKDHRDEYALQWVALKDGQLISHGPVAAEVMAAAREAGHPDVLFVLVEPTPPEGVKIINFVY